MVLPCAFSFKQAPSFPLSVICKIVFTNNTTHNNVTTKMSGKRTTIKKYRRIGKFTKYSRLLVKMLS